MPTRKQAIQALIAAGLAGTTIPAAAQPFTVNGDGATLQENFLRAPAATNDFIDVDLDGAFGPAADQLAPSLSGFPTPTPGANGAYWWLSYRLTGSGNGFAALRDWSQVFATAPDGDPANFDFFSEETSSDLGGAFVNRTDFLNGNGVIVPGLGQAANPGGTPFRTDTTTYEAIQSTTTGGLQIDFAVLDVPGPWFVQNTAGTPVFNAVPNQPGYGTNPRLATDKDGNLTTRGNLLRDLTANPLDANNQPIVVNTDESNPDSDTLFSTPTAFVPVGAIVNLGVGLEQMDMSDIRHLAVTGRRNNGENLTKITRDSGSGTRNGFMNGIATDPSWGVGENIGERNSSSTFDRVGPDYLPSNKGGSSRMEGTTQNTRLGIGHTGAERGARWLTSVPQELELLAIVGDVKGGSTPARPTLANVLDGTAEGYTVIGPASIVTLGDPRANSAAAGGWGWAAGENGAYVNNTPMANEAAAAFVNNITRSITAIQNLNPNAIFTPGEFLAVNFILPAAANNIPATAPTPGNGFVDIIPNPDFNQAVQDFVVQQAGNILAEPEFASFDTNTQGVVPERTAGEQYSDGNVLPSVAYVAQNGTLYNAGDALPAKSSGLSFIAGDFNNDFARDLDDAAEMILAYNDRQGGAAWNAPGGGGASIEILGDFNNDGNFTLEDLRYWADGLAIDDTTGLLDRFEGFKELQDAPGAPANLFGINTPYSTGASYKSGDAAADIAGSMTKSPTRGWTPNAHDGNIDDADIDYVVEQFVADPNAEIDWADTAEAAFADLSADINGDLLINKDDVEFIVEDILESELGDVNLDGVVDATDASIASSNFGAVGWASGDVNCDGIVDQADVDFINSVIGVGPCSAADVTTDGTANGIPDGEVTLSDFSFYLALWGAGDAAADLTTDGTSNGIPDGAVTLSDFSFYLALWGVGCP